MTPSQFQELKQMFVNLDNRVRRIERWSFTAAGGILVIAFLISNHIITIGGGTP